jgi:NitT/TauT family transport system permease protein
MAYLAASGARSARRALDQRLTTEPARPRLSYERWLPILAVATALALWEGLSRGGAIPALYFPAPTVILSTLIELAGSGELWGHLRLTLSRVLGGLIFGGVPGLLLGLAMGASPRLRAAVDPFIAALHPIPKIALLPLIMVIFGIGETSKVIVISVAAFFPMLINTMTGVRQLNPIYFEVAENYGASRAQLFRRVVLPGSLPMALSGLRLALNLALLLTIAVEIVASHQGLGALVWRSWEVLRTDVLYASLVVTALLGVSFSQLVHFLTLRLVPWQVDRGAATR